MGILKLNKYKGSTMDGSHITGVAVGYWGVTVFAENGSGRDFKSLEIIDTNTATADNVIFILQNDISINLKRNK